MTDSISAKLDLCKLPKAALVHLPLPAVSRGDRRKQSYIIPFDAKQSWKSPLTREAMQIKTLANPLGDPLALTADVNIPNATVGQNAELGHSIFAASTVALELFKVYLAEHRVGLELLDLLTIADLDLGSATITYLVPVPDDRSAQECIETIERRFCQFFPLTKGGKYGGSGVGSKGSRTAYCKRRGWYIRVYSTPASNIPGDDPAVRKDRIAFVRRMIRIELTLTKQTLRKERLLNVSDWQDAHADGTYKRLFDTYVRNKGLRLNERLRQDKPDATDLNKLCDTNRHIVEGYLAGKSLENCLLLQRHSKLAAQKAKSAARLNILKQLRIDIEVDWVEHRRLGSVWLDKAIVYAGDHNPPPERVADSVCRENLPNILQQVRDAKMRAATRHTATAGVINTGMGHVFARPPADPAFDDHTE